MMIDEKEIDNAAVAEPMFTVEVLKLTRELQQQHGLRHGDYQRYRGYCSRRVRRLRKALKIPQGDKRHFKRRDVTLSKIADKNLDLRMIHVPLMLAERCWAYALQLRQEANTEPRKKFHVVSKLRKACTYAFQFQNICSGPLIDARTKLEAEAYVAWIHGILQFELLLWKPAAESLKKAQVIYENLAKTCADPEQNVYKSKCDELTPSLRYCAYNIGEGASIDDLIELRAKGLLDNLDMLVSQANNQNENLHSGEWRGHKFFFRQEKVRLFLLSVQEVDKSLEKTSLDDKKIQILDNLLMDCKDAITAVKDDIIQDQKLKSVGQTSISNQQYLLAYLGYIRLVRTIQRNLYLVSQIKSNLFEGNDHKAKVTEGKRVRPQDLTRLYEIILQNVSELQQISCFEKDQEYQNEITSLIISFKAFRCYFIALTLGSFKRWREAVAMYERSMKNALEAIKLKPPLFHLEEELKTLIQAIESCKFSAHAYSVLEHDNENSVLTTRTEKSVKPLFERLSTYKEDQQLNSRTPNVFKLTASMKPIFCKPLFFDLAFNYTQLPSLTDKLDMSHSKQSAGISSFVKGFLGWGGQK